MYKVGISYESKENKKELGFYKKFRLEVVTYDDSAKVTYYGYLDKGDNVMPIMKSADSLENLKAKINEYIKGLYN